jgi:hypothetical protein
MESGDVFRPGSAGKGSTLPSNNTDPTRAGVLFHTEIHKLESESPDVGLSGAVSGVHVNEADRELGCSSHVKDDVLS